MGIQVWDIDKILQEAKSFIEIYGELPGRKKLTKIGRGDFINAVNKYYPGNMTQLRIDLNAHHNQKPKGFWTKENIISETKNIIKGDGRMPTEGRLRELGLNTINKYSQKYFGGLHGLAIACGVNEAELLTKFGYWKNFDNVKKEIDSVIEKLGRFPRTTDLKILNKHYLLSAISFHYGGLKNVRKFMGYTKGIPIAKDGHYCDSFSEVIIDDFLSTNNIPHRKDLSFNLPEYNPRPDFVLDNMILIEVLRNDYRIEQKFKDDIKYVNTYKKKRMAYKKAKLEVIEVFPDELINKEKLDKKLKLIAEKAKAKGPVTIKNFSNIRFFNKKSPGFWAKPENLKSELLPLIKKYGRIPPIETLRKIGRNDIEGAIVSIYGSYSAVAKAIGLNPSDYPKPQRFWQDIENLKKELNPIIKKYGYIPGKAELKRLGKEGVVAAIETYYKSFKEVATILGVAYKPLKETNGHWLSEENIKAELQIIVTNLRRFPTASDLRKYKKHGLLKGILSTYGNFRNAATKLGFKVPKNKPKGYWKSLSNVLTELDYFVNKYEKIPSCKIIEKEKPILMYAIRNYHGGMQKVKSIYRNERKNKDAI